MIPEINPVLLLQPLAVTLIAVALVVYWSRRKGISRWVLGFSLLAYASAIIIKAVFQQFTWTSVLATGNPFLQGVYFGLQTAVLEVGLAYLVARYAISKRKMKRNDAAGYGIGLAFWENGVLLGALPFLSLAAVYAVLAAGGTAAATAYGTLEASSPAYFYPTSLILPSLLWGVLERISSIILHVAFGYLAFIAAYTKRKRYLALALPMGLVDFLVPFAGSMGLAAFETLVFALSLIALAVAVYAKRSWKA